MQATQMLILVNSQASTTAFVTCSSGEGGGAAETAYEAN